MTNHLPVVLMALGFGLIALLPGGPVGLAVGLFAGVAFAPLIDAAL